MMKSLTALLLIGFISLQAQDPLQKRNLEPASSPRFTLTDRVWPASHGEADVCIWADDKLCAVSITIDDNPHYEKDWWLSMAAKYGIQITWMLVTGGLDNSGGTFGGNWADWQVAFDAGMECQSHTSTHNCSPENLDSSGIYYEYAVSQQDLNANLIGNRALVMAGPCGAVIREEAKKYWIANRGVRGTLDPVNKMDYMNTGYISLSLANLQGAIRNRSWYTILYHSVAQNQIPVADRQPIYDATEKKIAYLKQYEADVWAVGFARAAQYGQSRDTHTLTVDEVTADLVRFTLTDSMNDTLFDAPLTVKIRLDDNWSSLYALQNGDTLDAQMVFHEGAKYALINAVPDQGEVRVERYEPDEVVLPEVVTATGRYLDTVTVTLLSMTSGASLYYTLDGSDPTESSTAYTAPFIVTDDADIRVKGYKTGKTASPVGEADVVIERDAPEVTEVTAIADPTLVYVYFDEIVDSLLAASTATYTIDNGISITGTEVLSGGTLVKLTVSDLSADTDYLLAVNGLRDISNNPIATGTEVQFSFEPPPSDSGLTGLWRFDEADGAAMALDGTGDGNNATVYGGAFGPGQRNNGLILNGTEESYVDLGTSAFGMYGTYQFSLAFWLRVDYNQSCLLAKRGTYTWPFSLSYSNTSRQIGTGIRGASGSFWMSYTFPDTVADGEWVHVAISHSDSNISYYWNGAQVASFDTVHTIYKNNSNTKVGLSLNGMLDEFRIYSIGISADDVAALYADTTVDQTTDIKALANIRTFEHSNSERSGLYRLSGERIPVWIKPAPGIYLEFDGQKIRKTVILK